MFYHYFRRNFITHFALLFALFVFLGVKSLAQSNVNKSKLYQSEISSSGLNVTQFNTNFHSNSLALNNFSTNNSLILSAIPTTPQIIVTRIGVSQLPNLLGLNAVGRGEVINLMAPPSVDSNGMSILTEQEWISVVTTGGETFTITAGRFGRMLRIMGLLGPRSMKNPNPPEGSTPLALVNLYRNAPNNDAPIRVYDIAQAFIDQGGKIRDNQNNVVNYTNRTRLVTARVLKGTNVVGLTEEDLLESLKPIE